MWETELGRQAPAWGLSRRALDARLAERAMAAGVDLRSGTTVTGIAGDLVSGFTVSVAVGGVETGLRARAVIAAHGKRSSLDRVLGRDFLRQRQPYVALKAHYDGPPLTDDANLCAGLPVSSDVIAGMDAGAGTLARANAQSCPDTRPSRRLELRLFPGGYCGVTDIENGAANVCLLVRESTFRAAAGTGAGGAARFIAWLRGQDCWLEDWLGRARPIHERWLSISQVPFLTKDLVHDDILMTGDAAGLIAPLAGDGIAMALAGGSLAAQFVAAYLGGRLSADGLRRDYAAAWRREFGPRLGLGRVLQPLLMQPGLAGLGLRLANLMPGLGRALLHGTRDLGPLTKTDPVGWS
jgi:menaquinone-9 beta-reductase